MDAPSTTAPATAGPSSTAAAEPGAGGADLLEQRLLATQRWLAQEQGGIYSIQLLGSNDPQMLMNYLQSLSDYIEIDKIFVYRTVANQEPSMTVLVRSFSRAHRCHPFAGCASGGSEVESPLHPYGPGNPQRAWSEPAVVSTQAA